MVRDVFIVAALHHFQVVIVLRCGSFAEHVQEVQSVQVLLAGQPNRVSPAILGSFVMRLIILECFVGLVGFAECFDPYQVARL